MTRHVAAAALAAGLVALSIRPINALSWHTPPPRFQTEAATIGTIVRSVEADGTVRARETVPVGSQVSGTVAELHADFNSVVHRGEVLARLDPSLAKAALAEARADLAQAEADAQGARVARNDAKYQLGQARTLRAKQEIPQADLETAEATFRHDAVGVDRDCQARTRAAGSERGAEVRAAARSVRRAAPARAR
jgi:HlyD family secretion protein